MNELYHYGVKGMRWGVHKAKDVKWGPKTDINGNWIEEPKTKKTVSNNFKKGAVIAAGVFAAYSAHKVLNSPTTINTGKAFINKALKASNKLSKGVTSSTEYKMAKAAAGGVKSVGKGIGKAGDTIFNDKTVKAITGIGAMATTAQLLRTQIKDLKDIRSQHDDDTLNKVLNEVKKMSEIGESASKLAKGPIGQSEQSGKSSKGTDPNLLVKTRNLKSEIGDPKGMHGAEDEKRYQALFQKNPTDDQRAWIKAMRKNGYSVDQIEQYIFHSGYFGDELYHYGVKGMRWGIRHDKDKSNSRSTSSDDPDSPKSRGLSDKQKKAIKYGALAVGTGVAIYGAYKVNQIHNSKDIGKVIDINKYANKTHISDMEFDYNSGRFKVPDVVKGMGSGVTRGGLAPNEINKTIVSKMNPSGDQNNCFHTSIGYVLNSRFGQNVEALANTGIDEASGMVSPGRPGPLINAVFDNVKTTNFKSSDLYGKMHLADLPNPSKAMSNIPNNSHGILKVNDRLTGLGHFLNYEKDNLGRVSYVDCQTGRIFDNIDRVGGKSWAADMVYDLTDATLKKNHHDVTKYFIKKRS